MMGRPAAAVMRHLLPRPFGVGGEERIALVVQRARQICTIATVVRGVASSDTTSYWCHVYPLRLADADAEGQLFSDSAGWRENLASDLANRLRATFGPVNVDAIAAYVLAVLSAPSFRSRYSAELAIDHPRIPFPADAETFGRMVTLGEELMQAHLLEADIADDVRFEGAGSNRIDEIRFDDAGSAVWINQGQRFTGIALAAWNWGGSFRPLEHWLSDRRGRALDFAQIQQFQHSIQAVRTSLSLEPALDSALDEILAQPAEFGSEL